MNDTRIPTLLGIALLIVGMMCGVILIRTQQFSASYAATKLFPKDIRVSNITDSSFTVSWITQEKTSGKVNVWSRSSGRKTVVGGNRKGNLAHWINVEDLTENTTYAFTIDSGDFEFNNEGIPWQVTTGPKLQQTPAARVISGIVFTADAKPLEGILVYATVSGGNPLSTKTASDGTWFIPISSARQQTLDSYISEYKTESTVEIFVQGGLFGITSAKTKAETLTLPPLVLGRPDHDFRALKTIQNSEIPEAQINLPGEESSEVRDESDETVKTYKPKNKNSWTFKA